MAAAARRALPKLIVFDLDACLWTPEMFELSSAPTAYSTEKGGVIAGGDVVTLFPGAKAVLRRLLTDAEFSATKVAVASSTTEPKFANRCLDVLPADHTAERGERLSDLVDFRQIYVISAASNCGVRHKKPEPLALSLSPPVSTRSVQPGSKGRQHFPALHKESGVEYASMLFFDDCTYGDNCQDVARSCQGTTCVRTPQGLTEQLFAAGLDAWANGERGVVR